MKKKSRAKSAKRVDSLTDAQVRAIRRAYAGGRATQRALADKYELGVHQVGRITRGEARADAGGTIATVERTKLSAGQVATLRRRYAKGVATQASLAREYGISAAAVSRLVRGHTYDGVGGPRVDVGEMPHGRKLTPRQILEVAESDKTLAELARKFGVSRQAVQALRKRWATTKKKSTRKKSTRKKSTRKKSTRKKSTRKKSTRKKSTKKKTRKRSAKKTQRRRR